MATVAIVTGVVSVYRHDACIGGAVVGVGLVATSLLLMLIMFLISDGSF